MNTKIISGVLASALLLSMSPVNVMAETTSTTEPTGPSTEQTTQLKDTVIDIKDATMKATYGEFGDKKLFIYKDPKTDDGNLKKSHKGCCQVWKYSNNGPFVCHDEHAEWAQDHETMLKTVFKDGELTKFYNFMDIRREIYG